MKSIFIIASIIALAVLGVTDFAIKETEFKCIGSLIKNQSSEDKKEVFIRLREYPYFLNISRRLKSEGDLTAEIPHSSTRFFPDIKSTSLNFEIMDSNGEKVGYFSVIGKAVSIPLHTGTFTGNCVLQDNG